MKLISSLFFLCFTLESWGNSWQIIGRTIDCEEQISIEAKIGANHVRAILDGRRHILFPHGNYVFTKDSPIKLTFDSYNRRRISSKSPLLIYIHPSSSMPPEGLIKISSKDKKLSCRIKLEE